MTIVKLRKISSGFCFTKVTLGFNLFPNSRAFSLKQFSQAALLEYRHWLLSGVCRSVRIANAASHTSVPPLRLRWPAVVLGLQRDCPLPRELFHKAIAKFLDDKPKGCTTVRDVTKSTDTSVRPADFDTNSALMVVLLLFSVVSIFLFVSKQFSSLTPTHAHPQSPPVLAVPDFPNPDIQKHHNQILKLLSCLIVDYKKQLNLKEKQRTI